MWNTVFISIASSGKGAGTDTGGHVLFGSKDPGRVYPGSLSAQSRPWQRARPASPRAQRDAFADDPAGMQRRLVRKTYTASEFPMRPTQVQVEKGEWARGRRERAT